MLTGALVKSVKKIGKAPRRSPTLKRIRVSGTVFRNCEEMVPKEVRAKECSNRAASCRSSSGRVQRRGKKDKFKRRKDWNPF